MLRRLAILALFALPLPAFAEEAPAPAPAPQPPPATEPPPTADPTSITVPTVALPNDVLPSPGGPTASGRTGVFVQQPSLPVEFDEAKAEDGARTWTGTLEVGARTFEFRLRMGAPDELTLSVDQDGDGKVDPAKESLTAKARPWTMGKANLGTEWAFEGLRLAGAPVLAQVHERTPGFNAQALVPGREGARPQVTPLLLTDAAPEVVKTPPKLEGAVRYLTGKIRTKDVVAAFVRGEGDALTLVWAEAATGDLAAGQDVPMTATPTMRGKKRIGTRWQSAPVAVGDGTVVFQVNEAVPNLQGMVNAPATRRGTTTIGSAEWSAFFMDGDLDGSFTGAEDWWWLGPTEKEMRPNTSNMTEGDQPRWIGRGAVRLSGLDKDGNATFVQVKDAPSFESYLRRRTERVNAKRWFPRFEEDKEFAASRKLDASRPRAEKPAEFRFARTLAEAKALAATNGKPLLVDFEADWCVWCKRLDFHTYPDREVAELLGKFTAVKINNELDPAKSFRSMKSPSGEQWTGIPAIAFFDHQGNVLLFRIPGPDGKPGRVVDHIPGWLKPELFAAALRAALEQWEAVKAGGEPLKVEPLPPRGHHGGDAPAPKPTPEKPPGDAPPAPPPPPAPTPEQPK